MSHFSTIVALNGAIQECDLEKALGNAMEPFCEVTDNIAFLQFEDCTNALEEKYQEETIDQRPVRDLFSFEQYAERCGYHRHGDRFGYHVNINAKWDWFEVGGRFCNKFLVNKTKRVDIARKKDILWDDMSNPAVSTFAFLQDGEWHESGSAGWFGVSTNNKEENLWKQEIQTFLAGLPENTWLVNVDCHI